MVWNKFEFIPAVCVFLETTFMPHIVFPCALLECLEAKKHLKPLNESIQAFGESATPFTSRKYSFTTKDHLILIYFAICKTHFIFKKLMFQFASNLSSTRSAGSLRLVCKVLLKTVEMFHFWFDWVYVC